PSPSPGRRCASERLFDEVRERTLRRRAYVLADDLTALEDIERQDATNTVLRRGSGALVDVDFGHLRQPFILAGELLDEGCDLLARAAPGGGKIDQDREVRLEHLLVEVEIIDAVHTTGHLGLLGSSVLCWVWSIARKLSMVVPFRLRAL